MIHSFSWWATFLPLLFAAHAGSLGSHFPRDLGAPLSGSPVVAEQGKDTLVFVAAGNQLHAFTTDGRQAVGYPLSLGQGEEAVGDVAAADFDGDGKADVAVTTKSGKLFVFSNATVLAGFPVTLEGGCSAGPSFGDLNGDGRPELLQGDRAGNLHAFRPGGHEWAPFPIALGQPLTSPVSVGLFRGGVALAVGAEQGTVFVLDSKGVAVQGFPLKTHFTVTAAPVFGDVDDDGRVDLIVASADFSLYASDDTGTLLSGFPVHTGLACYGSPALADIDGDDVLDIVFTSTDGQLYVVNGHGQSLPHFPLMLGSNLRSGVAIGDVDRDGVMKIIISGRDGSLYVVSAAGKIVSSKKFGAAPLFTPYLWRGKDGNAGVFFGGDDGKLESVRFAAKTQATAAAAIAWAGAGHDAARAGAFKPNPRRYKNLQLVPAAPRIDDALKASWTFVAIDGQIEPPPPIGWLRNGKRVKELDGHREVPARTIRKHEHWRFELTLPSHAVQSAEVTVLDTAPSAPKVRIQPSVLSVDHDATLDIPDPSTDADGDPITYRYLWLLDGKKTQHTSATLRIEQAKKGQRLTAIATAFDGELEGPPGFADGVVGNSAPEAPVFALKYPTVRQGEPITPTLVKQARDPDGDPVHNRYRWQVNAQPRNYPMSQAALSTSLLKKGDRVAVAVSAFDGVVEGPAWTGEVTVVNTPPTEPKIAIQPPSPRALHSLRATVQVPARDADGDFILYRTRWKRNGQPYAPPADPFEVPAGDVKKGDRWSVEVTPNDGEADGPNGRVEVTIQNTPPGPAVLGLVPSHPNAGGQVEVQIVHPSEDADGDAVKYTYAWMRNGVPAGTEPKEGDRRVLSGKDFKKHEILRVTATPSDGTAAGPLAVAEVTIDNALPTAPGVVLEPASPTALEPLKALVKVPSQDADGEALKYRYQWALNGIRQELPDTQAELPASLLKKNQRWTVSVRAHDGEALGPPGWASAQIGNTPPPPPLISISPAAPKKGQSLRAVVAESLDPDGDLVTYRYVWHRDGAEVALPQGTDTIGRDQPRKGELWAVDVTASDGEAESRPAHAEVRIVNTPPTAPAVSLCAAPVPAGAAIEVALPTPARDVDGDAISYHYTWTLNGQPNLKWSGKKALGPGDTHKHDLLVIAVTPNDATVDGLPGRAECAIENTPPGAPRIELDPASVTAESGVRARIVSPADDRDGDVLQYRYAWFKNGIRIDPGKNGTELKPKTLKRGDEVTLRVTSFDGEQEGGIATASARVVNTPPPKPIVLLTPVDPPTGAALLCAAQSPERDIDGDPVTVHRRWSRNGVLASLAEDQATLPSGLIKAGEHWRCESWTDDGYALSEHAAAEVTVRPGTPSAPGVSIEPTVARTDDDLFCRIAVDSVDPDGERVQYQYQWTRDGQPVAPAGDPATVAHQATHRGETWRCSVTPRNSAHPGPAAAAELKISNSPPGAAQVAIGPRPAIPAEPIHCDIAQPAVDPDGDKVQYHFSWFKDGALQSFGPTSQEVPARLVKSKDLWSCEVTATDGELEGPTSSGGSIAVP